MLERRQLFFVEKFIHGLVFPKSKENLEGERQKSRNGKKHRNNDSQVKEDFFSPAFNAESAAVPAAESSADTSFRTLKKDKDDEGN